MTGKVTPQEAVERALAASPADECIVIADETSSANLRFAGNTLTTNGLTRSRQLTVIAFRHRPEGVRAGVVSRAGVLDGKEIEEVAVAADEAAANGMPAEDANPLISDSEPSRDWDAEPGQTSFAVFSRLAPTLGDVFSAAEAGQRKLFGYAEHEVTSTFLASSGGLRLRHDQADGQLQFNAKSPDFTRSAWAGLVTENFADVDVAAVDSQLAQRLEWARRRIDLSAGRYETLLPPSAIADLMIYLYWSAGAKDAHEGRTVFAKPGGGTKVGERLASVPVTLFSDPQSAGITCAPFVIAHASSRNSSVFDNGLPLRRTDWIREGELSALVQTRHSAKLTGLPVTPGVDNLALYGPADAPSLDEMISSTRRGLLLTCLWYIREVDPETMLLTGLSRDGVYLVEGGEIVGEVNNFRWNESPVALLGRIAEVGRTERTLPREWNDWFTRTAMPPVRVMDFNMSTISQAL